MRLRSKQRKCDRGFVFGMPLHGLASYYHRPLIFPFLIDDATNNMETSSCSARTHLDRFLMAICYRLLSSHDCVIVAIEYRHAHTHTQPPYVYMMGSFKMLHTMRLELARKI